MADTAADLGPLPSWNLGDLYPGPDSPELAGDLERCETEAKAFRARHEGKVAGMSGTDLGRAIAAYETLDEILGRVMSYAHLLYAGDMSDPEIGRFFQSMQERVNAISTELLFFALEINRIDEAELEAKLKAPELAHFRP